MSEIYPVPVYMLFLFSTYSKPLHANLSTLRRKIPKWSRRSGVYFYEAIRNQRCLSWLLIGRDIFNLLCSMTACEVTKLDRNVPLCSQDWFFSELFGIQNGNSDSNWLSFFTFSPQNDFIWSHQICQKCASRFWKRVHAFWSNSKSKMAILLASDWPRHFLLLFQTLQKYSWRSVISLLNQKSQCSIYILYIWIPI